MSGVFLLMFKCVQLLQLTLAVLNYILTYCSLMNSQPVGFNGSDTGKMVPKPRKTASLPVTKYEQLHQPWWKGEAHNDVIVKSIVNKVVEQVDFSNGKINDSFDDDLIFSSGKDTFLERSLAAFDDKYGKRKQELIVEREEKRARHHELDVEIADDEKKSREFDQQINRKKEERVRVYLRLSTMTDEYRQQQYRLRQEQDRYLLNYRNWESILNIARQKK